MPTIKLQGGLGNQMFEYALAYSLSQQYNEDIIFDGFFLENRLFGLSWAVKPFELGVFGIQKTYKVPNLFSRKFIHPLFNQYTKKILFGERYIKEEDGNYIKEFPRNAYLEGWFQSYKYFDTYATDITRLFTVQTDISHKNQVILNQIEGSGKKSVSIHVRRGDYVSIGSTNKWHGVCSVEYYIDSIHEIIKELGSPVFFVFSDDIAWCKENITFPDGITSYYVDNGNAGHEDMQLMYSCSHHIIANSSFSWWGAYLGRNPDKIIIAPKKWLQTDSFNTTELIPQSWRRL